MAQRIHRRSESLVFCSVQHEFELGFRIGHQFGRSSIFHNLDWKNITMLGHEKICVFMVSSWRKIRVDRSEITLKNYSRIDVGWIIACILSTHEWEFGDDKIDFKHAFQAQNALSNWPEYWKESSVEISIWGRKKVCKIHLKFNEVQTIYSTKLLYLSVLHD